MKCVIFAPIFAPTSWEYNQLMLMSALAFEVYRKKKQKKQTI